MRLLLSFALHLLCDLETSVADRVCGEKTLEYEEVGFIDKYRMEKQFLTHGDEQELLDTVCTVIKSHTLYVPATILFVPKKQRVGMEYDAAADVISINTLRERTKEEFIKIFVHEVAHANGYNKIEIIDDSLVHYGGISVRSTEDFLEVGTINNTLLYLQLFNEGVTELYAEQIFNVLKTDPQLGIHQDEGYFDHMHSPYRTCIRLINDLLTHRQKDVSLNDAHQQLLGFYKSGDIQGFIEFISGGTQCERIEKLFQMLNEGMQKSYESNGSYF